MVPKVLVAASATPILLSLLAHGESYGYEIIQRIDDLSDGSMQWTAGMLYPVLHRLETQGLIQATWRKAENGRRRKYYRLTTAGREALRVEKQQWLDVHALLTRLWGPELQLT